MRTNVNGMNRYASAYGHIRCLIYAHENGCEWDENTCRRAIVNEKFDCFKYALDNGCECGIETYSTAKLHGGKYLEYIQLKLNPNKINMYEKNMNRKICCNMNTETGAKVI